MASGKRKDHHRSLDSPSFVPGEDDADQQQDIVFPMKLHQLLDTMEETGQTSIIGWMSDGKGFKIKDRKKFAQEVMPKFFGTNKLKSFQRNLNLWGFASGKKLEERGIYTRRHFVRGKPELCSAMKRRKRIPKAKCVPPEDRKRKTKSSSEVQNEPAARRAEDSSTSSSASSVATTETKEKDEGEDEDEEDEDERKPQPRLLSDETRTAAETIPISFGSSDAIIQELRRRQHNYQAPRHQQEGLSTNNSHGAAWLPHSAAAATPAASLTISPQPLISSSLLQGLIGGGSSTAVPTSVGGTTSSPFPWLDLAAASASPSPAAVPSASNIIANSGNSAGALLNAYLLSQQQQQQQTLPNESSLMQSVAAILLQQQQQQQLLQQQQQQQQEQAAAAAAMAAAAAASARTHDQVIANALRDYAAADEEQKRKVTLLLLMLHMESSKAR